MVRWGDLEAHEVLDGARRQLERSQAEEEE
jgi:hypothetical protein